MRFASLAALSIPLLPTLSLAAPARDLADINPRGNEDLEKRVAFLAPIATTAATWVLEQLVDLVTDSMEDAQKTWMADTAKEIGTNIINQEYGNYNVVIFLDDIWDDSNYYISTEFADCAHVEWEPLGDFLDIFGSPGSQGYQVCAFKEGEFLVTATEDEDMWTWWGWCDTTEDGGVQCSAP